MIQKISQQLNLQTSQVENTLKLLEEGATIPFIARYRKERTNQLYNRKNALCTNIKHNV